MNELTAKQIDHIASWQGRIDSALDQITSLNPREQSMGIEILEEFSHRFDVGSAVSANLFDERREMCEDRLLELAERDNKFVASAAMRWLVQIGSLRGLETARLHLDCENPHLVEAAIGLFGLSADREELCHLEKFLHHTNRRLRNAAVKALSQHGYKRALPVFLELLGDLRCRVRETFGQMNIPGSQIRILLAAIVNIQGEEAIPLLVEIATDDVGMRTYAIDALMGIDPVSAAPAVVHMLADKSASLVSGVLRLIVKADYRPAIPLVRPLLCNSDGSVRFHALNALIEWNDAESAETLSLMTKEETAPPLRCLAVSGLAKLRPEKCENEIASLLGDLNVQVRVAAVKALASLEELSPDTELALQHVASHDESEQVRELAAQAGGHETRNHHQIDGDQFIPPPILLIPPQLVQAAPATLAYLSEWRESLPQLAGTCPILQINDLDRSLGSLIRALEEIE